MLTLNLSVFAMLATMQLIHVALYSKNCLMLALLPLPSTHIRDSARACTVYADMHGYCWKHFVFALLICHMSGQTCGLYCKTIHSFDSCASSSFAIDTRCTSSGPSASLSVLAPLHMAANGKSSHTPAPPCTCSDTFHIEHSCSTNIHSQLLPTMKAVLLH